MKIQSFIDCEKLWLKDIHYDLSGIKNSSYDEIHSILFPDVHYFTKHLDLYTHDKVFHGETEITLNKMGLNLWKIKVFKRQKEETLNFNTRKAAVTGQLI